MKDQNLGSSYQTEAVIFTPYTWLQANATHTHKIKTYEQSRRCEWTQTHANTPILRYATTLTGSGLHHTTLITPLPGQPQPVYL